MVERHELVRQEVEAKNENQTGRYIKWLGTVRKVKLSVLGTSNSPADFCHHQCQDSITRKYQGPRRLRTLAEDKCRMCTLSLQQISGQSAGNCPKLQAI
jgi:hypothetical protein